MRIRTTDCCLIRKGSGIVMTQEQSNQNECQILIYSVQDFLARHSLSPESEKDLQMQEDVYKRQHIDSEMSKTGTKKLTLPDEVDGVKLSWSQEKSNMAAKKMCIRDSSNIMDTDMATEMTEYAAQNIRDQAGISVRSQANDLPQQVLSLLSR